MRKLQTQVLSLNQQLLLMTQQSHKYLQELRKVRTGTATASTSPSGVGGLSTLGGNATASTSPVFAGSGVNLGMLTSPQVMPSVGIPMQMGAQMPPAPQLVPAATMIGQGNAAARTSPIFGGSGVNLGMFAPSQFMPPVGAPGQMGGQVQPAPQPVPTATTTGLGGGVVTTSVITPSRGTMGNGSMSHGPAQQ